MQQFITSEEFMFIQLEFCADISSLPGNNSLLAVEVVGEEELVITNETVNFQWKDHGFKLHVPKNALPEGVSEHPVNIKASLAGQFELPEGYELVSTACVLDQNSRKIH